MTVFEQLGVKAVDFRLPKIGDRYLDTRRGHPVVAIAEKNFTSIAMAIVAPDNVYNKFLHELVAPVGYTFSGEFRKALVGETYLACSYASPTPIEEVSSVAPVMILRKTDPVVIKCSECHDVDNLKADIKRLKELLNTTKDQLSAAHASRMSAHNKLTKAVADLEEVSVVRNALDNMRVQRDTANTKALALQSRLSSLKRLVADALDSQLKEGFTPGVSF